MIILSIGHDLKRQGAAWDGLSEYHLSQDVAAFIDHPDILILNRTLTATVDEINLIPNVTFAAELHWNAGGDAKTAGCETLYCPGSKAGKHAAEQCQRVITKATHTRDRGVKEGWYQMRVGGKVDWFLRATKCPAVILEPEFIRQVSAGTKYKEYCQRMADIITTALIEANEAI